MADGGRGPGGDADVEGPFQAALELRLYVSGRAPESATVEANLRRICDDAGLVYEVEVLDVDEHAESAERDRIVLTPTLLRLTPPQLRVAGDLSDIESALDGLGLRVWEQRFNDRGAGAAGVRGSPSLDGSQPPSPSADEGPGPMLGA
jgi:circadian clock protein KaiB